MCRRRWGAASLPLCTARQAPLDLWGLRVLLDLSALWGRLVGLAWQVRLAALAWLVRRGLLVLPGLLAAPESPVLRGCPVLSVPSAHPVALAVPVRLVRRVSPDLLAPLVRLGPLGLLAVPARRG